MNNIETITNALSSSVDLNIRNNAVKLIGLSNINESLSTHYLIYRIINNIDKKYYIGLHKTNNPYDNYMGSGKLITRAEEKYGLSNFTKEILFDFDNFEEMNSKEQELVPLSSCKDFNPLSYNIAEGGSHSNTSPSTKKLQSQKAKARFKKMNAEELLAYIIPMREGLSTWLSTISNEEYIKIKKTAGIKTSKTKRLQFENMSNEEYNIFYMQLSARGFLDTAGEKNPMYGKHLSNYMELTAYNALREKIAANNKIRATDSNWLLKMHNVSAGKNNPMYGHSCTEYMSEDKIKQWKDNISKATKGKNNPMYGKSSWEKCADEERTRRIEKFKASMKGKNKGKRCMKLPNETHWKYVKQEDIQKYLDLGYEFYSLNKGKKFKTI